MKSDLERVKENGLVLEYVKEQTYEICLEAVKEYGLALQFVKEQTPEICLAAIKQNSYTIKYVINQTEEICLEAVKEDVGALAFVKDLDMIKILNPEIITTKARTIYVAKIDDKHVFTVGCQINISKEYFIERIYNTDGGLVKNPHRQEYLDILERY